MQPLSVTGRALVDRRTESSKVSRFSFIGSGYPAPRMDTEPATAGTFVVSPFRTYLFHGWEVFDHLHTRRVVSRS